MKAMFELALKGSHSVSKRGLEVEKGLELKRACYIEGRVSGCRAKPKKRAEEGTKCRSLAAFSLDFFQRITRKPLKIFTGKGYVFFKTITLTSCVEWIGEEEEDFYWGGLIFPFTVAGN